MERKIIVNPGDKFNNWTVIKEIDVLKGTPRKVLCVNDLGKERIVRLVHLRSGASKGFMSHGKNNGNYSHGMRGTRIYRIWRNIKTRCLNKNYPEYHLYGERGISICDKWLTFEGFYDDMKDTYKDSLSIDRIDNSGNYCKENCRWATNYEQSINKRDTLYIYLNGEKVKFKEVSEKYGINYCTLYSRVFKYNIPIEEAIKQKVKKRKRDGIGIIR